VSAHNIGLGSGSGALLTVPALRAAARLIDRAEQLDDTSARTEHAIEAWDSELL
jgi:hypothetical protein